MNVRIICLVMLVFSNSIYAQSNKEELFKKDVVKLVEELEFIYGYDQMLREYILYKTFDKGETDSIERLPQNEQQQILSERTFQSDSIAKFIWRNYITPKDNKHTERIIEITKKYGFPSVKRIQKYYNKKFIDPEFNPYILLVHSSKKYWKEIQTVMKKELDEGRINKCMYGHILWHINGRNNMKYLFENGWEEIKDSTGMTRVKSTCN